MPRAAMECSRRVAVVIAHLKLVLASLGVGWVTLATQVDFTNTITLGAIIISSVGVLLTLVAYGFGAKWKAAATASAMAFEAMENERDVYRDKSERLEEENREQREAKHQALTELAAERLKHDFTPVLQAILTMQKTLEVMAATNDGRKAD